MSIRAVGAAVTTEVRDVPPERTAVSTAEISAAISRAYLQVTGSAPSSAMLRTLTAQASLETGRGTAMYNFNFGGIKGAGPHGESANCLTHEVIGGEDRVVRQDFRAYHSLDEGAVDYVRVMVQRFGSALPAAARGDLGGFAHALKEAGYFTASEASYTSALASAAGAGAAFQGEEASTRPQAPTAATFSTSVDLTRIADALSASALRIGEPSTSGS